jgi:cell division protein FtsQ
MIKMKEKIMNSNYRGSSFSFGIGLLFFLVVLFGFISLGWWLTQRFMAQESVPVTSIVVSGETPYSNRNDILKAIDTVDLGNFFQLDVDEVQANVLALPWVYSVAVRKEWPNELKIYVVDQQPVALWNGDFLINTAGNVFQAELSRVEHYLPKFFGPEGTEKIALQNYRSINRLLEYKSLKIDELVLTERFSWQLTLDDGVTLNLGREERVERVQRFMDVYPKIKAQLAVKNKEKINAEKDKNQAVDYIDLRYDTGLAVGWKTVTEKTNNNNSEIELNV